MIKPKITVFKIQDKTNHTNIIHKFIKLKCLFITKFVDNLWCFTFVSATSTLMEFMLLWGLVNYKIMIMKFCI